MNKLHIFKPAEIRVKKNKWGYWQTVKIDTFGGRQIPYNDVIGFPVSCYKAKKIFADDLNRANNIRPDTILLHPNYYINKKNK